MTSAASRWRWCTTIRVMPEQPGLAVRLEYCAQSGYLPRAQWMLGELLAALQDDVASFTLVPGGGGCFEWSVDGETVFSKLASGRFPEVDEIMELLADRL